MKRALVAVVVVVLGLVLASPVAAQTGPVTITEAGWFSQRPGAVALPDGGFEVTDGGPRGILSVAAFRVAVADKVTGAVLTLTETAGLPPVTGTLQACAGTGTWTAANPGAYEAAPVPNCAISARLARDTTTSTWSGDVQPLLASAPAGSEVTLVVMPGPPIQADLPWAAPFSLIFAGAAVTANAATAPTTTSPPTTSTPTTSPRPSGSSAPTFSAPSSGLLPTLTPPTAAAAPPTTAASVDLASPTVRPVSSGGGGKPKPWGRLALYVPLTAALGLAAARSRPHLERLGLVPKP